MNSSVVEADDLPDAPLDAAAEFHTRIAPSIRAAMAQCQDIAVMFGPGDHTHRAWRLAAIQELAREAAPCRVNAIVVNRADTAGVAQALRFVHGNAAITGQLIAVD